jgi:predicted alpha/beta-fold hydrolase
VLAAGRWLRDRGATSVGAVGFSLGAAAVLAAARRAGDGELEGGALSFSAPADLGTALDVLSTRPPLRDPLYGTWLTLHAAATTRLRTAGYGHEPRSLREVVELVSAPWYGADVDELARRASPAEWIDQVQVPVLAVHAVDDVVIPVDHARRLEERARGNPNVHVLLRPTGGHAAFDLVDPAWTAGVERAWLGALARWPVAG